MTQKLYGEQEKRSPRGTTDSQNEDAGIRGTMGTEAQRI